MTKWIKLPGPGQYRGEGDWYRVDESKPDKLTEYEMWKRTGYLPTAEQEDKPK